MNSDSSDRSLRTRRQVLGTIAGVSLSVAFAGCSDRGGDGTGTSLSTVTDSQQSPTESKPSLTPTRTTAASATQRTTTEAETSSSVTQTSTPIRTMNPTTRATTTSGTAEVCPSPPGADADPKALLPEPPSGWSLVDEHGEAAGMVGAEVGYSGVYAAPDGNEYGVEILRWPSSEKAQNGVLMYRGDDGEWQLRLVLGRFTFAVSGSESEPARMLLAASPALTENCVAERVNESG